MRYKSRYSLNLKSTLCLDYKIQQNNIYRQATVSDFTVGSILKKLDESLDLFGAFGTFLVEKAKTKEMQKRFDDACKFIERENQEILKQYSIMEKEYGERLIMEIEYIKNKYRMQAKEIEQTTKNLAESVSEQSRIENITRITPLMKMIKIYLNYMEERKSIIDNIISGTAEDFVKKNYYYYQLNDEYIKNFSVMHKYLNTLIAEQEV